MAWQVMGGSCNSNRTQIPSTALLIILLVIPRCFSLNSEGLALLEFCSTVASDPYLAFGNWNPDDHDPCLWSGVECLAGEVHVLDLSGRSLKGPLASALGNLTRLRSLVLSKNQFFGAIPKQLGQLTMLELLDLRDNNLSGTIPAEIGKLQSLKHLLLGNNHFDGTIPSSVWNLGLLADLQFEKFHASAFAPGNVCVNRKFGQHFWQSGVRTVKRAESFSSPIKGTLTRCLNLFPFFKVGKGFFHKNAGDYANNVSCSTEEHLIQPVPNTVNSARRKLAEQSNNVAAAVPATNNHVISLPSSRSSGSFPAVPQNEKESSPPPPQQGPVERKLPPVMRHEEESGGRWKYILGISSGIFLIFIAGALLIIFRGRAAKTIGPWKTGLSGQLQKAFVTGVPKLNRAELETACEDFSNIISCNDGCIVYKGTLSSGVEIAVASTTIASLQDWTNRAELAYRKKVDTLSRVNHKNFTNLIGFLEEDEPFGRMMVFEYAPNGTLFEHLHVKEVEHLDWNARMRIIMGIAYCLQYMHELSPPLAHSNLISDAIYLTDDYAAKVAEISFWFEFIASLKSHGENDPEHSELPPLADPETNVYSFGLLLLEMISGKLPHAEEEGPLLNWAVQYLNDKQRISNLIDPTLTSFKDSELDIICEVIQECTQPNTRKRPTMKDIISKLTEVLDISPDAAIPRLSPLWWAELEILSAEAP